MSAKRQGLGIGGVAGLVATVFPGPAIVLTGGTRSTHLPLGTWTAATRVQPDLAGFINEVRDVSARPEFEQRDPRPNRERRFSQVGPRRWLCVVVERSGGGDKVVAVMAHDNDPNASPDAERLSGLGEQPPLRVIPSGERDVLWAVTDDPLATATAAWYTRDGDCLRVNDRQIVALVALNLGYRRSAGSQASTIRIPVAVNLAPVRVESLLYLSRRNAPG